MCLHTRGPSQWNVSKAQRGDSKTPAENINVPKEAKDKKTDSKKNANNSSMEQGEKPITQLVITETQKTNLIGRCDGSKPKFREMDLNDNKNLKQNELNEKNQQLANSFIAEFTQKSMSKSGTCKKNESVIHDNTLEEIPRDMPKYDSLQ
ncbi:unnamed protein product [Cercopithifilaria johnstoni]|uniref:Uncharacterized protein n=1 Tax=Cercopithifilaria johnstoni TaxID=2874296 RepID=A0A8J2MC70_9BILA|nr:unnamed protein product [Cercopithifilaria johnstoni]